uniref:Glutathione peroxidase n=1 Tax=uncultured Armatimonadetes bacterium TaxID=157466 RepID=A0A6J4IZS5_9BACT|nr:Glutathione peroxidase @ Thioredoxin peroxidase [uncultured Armatimonadetes bacterium]
MSNPALLCTLATLTAAVVLATLPPAAEAAPTAKGPLGFTVKNIDGKDVPLSRYKGNVVMIVNTASLCGNTPQYAKLETLYQKYKGRGLRILAFPANDFGQQEPGSNTEIKTFCSTKYRTTFDLFGKVSVKGADQAPLYRYLTSKGTNPKYGGDVEWNFAKFLVGRDGQVVGRFPAGKDPLAPDVVEVIEAQLAKQPAKTAAAK